MKRFFAFLRRLRDLSRYRQYMFYDRDRSRFFFVQKYLRWSLRCRFGADVPFAGPERATAILVSYKRIHNMDPLVRCCLRCPWVEKVVVLNNNPAYRMKDWVRIRSPRVVLIDEGINKGAMERYVYAAQAEGTYFFSVDDDIFLYPEQLTALFGFLIGAPAVPHGMYAQGWLGPKEHPKESFQYSIVETDGEADILNRVYFFTKAHALECMHLIDALGYRTTEQRQALSPLDDVVLSFSGDARPQIHNIGRFIDCPTQAKPGVAQWMREDFPRLRVDIYTALERIKPRIAEKDSITRA